MKLDGYYTTFDVVKILDLKMERFQDWLKRGFIMPSIQYQFGRGKKKYFERWDIYLIRLFKHLLDSGISRKQAAAFVKVVGGFDPKKSTSESKARKFIRKSGRKPSTFPVYFVLTWDGENMSISPAYGSGDIKISKTGDTFVFNFRNIMHEIDGKLDK